MTAQANIRQFIDTLRKVERAPLVPRIDYRRTTGASQADREVTAFEMERLTVVYIAGMRRLFDNLQENLPVDARMESAESFIDDTLKGALDMVSNARGV